MLTDEEAGVVEIDGVAHRRGRLLWLGAGWCCRGCRDRRWLPTRIVGYELVRA